MAANNASSDAPFTPFSDVTQIVLLGSGYDHRMLLDWFYFCPKKHSGLIIIISAINLY